MDIDLITNILYATIRTGTPLILVAFGEMVCEKSGVLNLGQEGMMLMGAVVGFAMAVVTGSLMIAILMAILAGICMSLLFGFLSITLVSNQVASGLALTIFGGGLSAFIGANYVGIGIDGVQPLFIPFLSDIPIIGKALFQQDPLVYFSFFMGGLLFFVLTRTRLGLNLRAVGENPEAANSMGIHVHGIRYMAVMFGGAMAGLAGGYLSLAYTPLWSDGMTAGKGWIALALVVFASWKVGRIMLGAYLFGIASIMHLILQGTGFEISPSILAMMPYVATIFVLVLLSSNQSKAKLNAPMSLGVGYRPQL
ncbi:MAG: ABC transporter permease [Bermanella sp.]